MRLSLLTAVLATSHGADECPTQVYTDRGQTKKDYTYVGGAVTWEDCCQLCSLNSTCAAWTFHPNNKQGKNNCALAPYATTVMGSNRISGAKNAPPTPAPTPPAPTPPPLPPVVPNPPLGVQPNLILFLQDDQDVYMGGLTPMKQAGAKLAGKGATASSWFIHTPVCCPSRAEILSGRYFHNVREPTPKKAGSCMHVDENKVNPVSAASYLAQSGYTVGYFGKHMNDCPVKPPAGFDCDTCYWFANGGGKDREPGGYLNATFHDFSQWPQSLNGTYHASTSGEYGGYTTSVIGNKSIEWIRQVAKLDKPFFVTVASKAPHSPFTPAPWYQTGTFVDGWKAPRTPNYNVTGKDMHWLIDQQQPISETCADEIDENFRNRWRALLSVDDAISAMVDTIEELGLWNRTYMFMTSDHGYNLGQHRLPFGKHNVYDHATRIPMLMRGPGIRPGSIFSLPASNVDVPATLLGLAGVYEYAQRTMDGRSIAPLLVDPALAAQAPEATRRHLAEQGAFESQWRDFHLIEYYSLGNVTRIGHLVDDTESNTYRALRFIDSQRQIPGTALTYGNMLYSEFTAVADWFFENVSHYELFNMTEDPHQLANLYYSWASDGLKQALHELVVEEFKCQGASCLPKGFGHSPRPALLV